MTRPLRSVPRLHAFTGKRIATLRPEKGDTIQSFYDRASPGFGLPTIVAEWVGSELRPLPRRHWHRRIRTRDHLVLLSAPRGGGGQGGGSRGVASVLALVAVVAIATLVAGPAGAALAGAIGGISATAATSVISALIIGGGSMLISHFLGAKPGAKTQSLEYSTDITGNQARSQQPIPAHYGRLKFFPDLAQPIYTDYLGVDQVFHGLYSLGVGSFDIEEIGVGTQPMWTKAAGTLAGFPSLKFQQVEPEAHCDLFPVNVFTAPEVSGQSLPDPYGTKYTDGSISIGPNGEGQNNPGGPHYLGPFIAVPSGEVASDYAIDFIWPNGLYKIGGSSGNQKSADCRIQVFYQLIDDQGHILAAPVQVINKTYTYNSKIAVRLTEKFSIPTAARIQVFVARLDKAGRTEYTDTVNWAGLKAYLQGPNAVPYASRLAVQLVADNLLSGYSGQEIYVIATRKTLAYNATSGQLELRPNSNPVWAALDIWSDANYGGNLPIAKVDLPTLIAKAAEADTRGDTFNYRFTAQTTVLEAIETALRPMLTSPVYHWDRFSLVRDEPRGLPRLMLTDFEIVRGSLEIVYTLKDAQTSDGVILEYIDEDTWKPAEVTSREAGAVLLQPTRVKQDGLTNRRQATVTARYLAAVNNYRRMVLTLETEADARVLRRGSLVSVQSELPQTWGQALRIDRFDTASRAITVSVNADWSAAGNYYVRIRMSDGSPFGPVLCSRGSADNQIILNAADVALVQSQQGVLWTGASTRDQLQEPASIELSAGTPMSFQGLVTRITKGDGENSFKIEFVNDVPEVYAIDTTSVDPLPSPALLALPALPGALNDLAARLEQSSTSIMLYASWRPDPVAAVYAARVSWDNGTSWTPVYAGAESAFSNGPMPPEDCLLQIRGLTAAGRPGGWTQVALTSPGLVLNPASLGYGLGFDDLLPELYQAVQFQPLQALDSLVDLQALVTQANLVALQPVNHAVARAANAVEVESFSRVEADQSLLSYSVTLDAKVDDNAASVQQQFETQATTNEAVATSITTIEANVGANAAAIITEAQTRATADSATSTLIVNLTSTVSANLATTSAAITTEQQTRATADTAISTTVSNLSATVDSNLATTSASITTEAQTRATADSAISTTVSSLSATVASNLATTNASISTEAQTRATQDSALSTQISSVSASFTAFQTATAANFTTETQARASADTALTSSITSLTATVGGNTAAITTEQQARSNGDSALSTSLASLTTTVNGNSAAISTESQARSTADSALSTQLSSLTATVGSNTAAITTEQQARASGDSAVAASVSSLSTTVGGNTASISTLQASTSGLSVSYGIVGTIDGVTGGLIVYGALKPDGSVYYNITIRGDLIVDGTIVGNKVVDLSLANAKIADNAVSNLVFVESSGAYDNISASITVESNSSIKIDFSAQCYYQLSGAISNTDEYDFQYILALNGSDFYSSYPVIGSSGSLSVKIPATTKIDVSPGTYTIAGRVSISGSGGSRTVRDPSLCLTAFKK